MKKLFVMAALACACLLGCEGVAPDNGNETPGGNENNTSDLKGAITLYSDRDIIMADDDHTAHLKVLLMDQHGVEHDVTADVEIYYEGSDKPVASPDFKTSQSGEYVFYALRGLTLSNKVTVKALKGVSALPADPSPASVDFRHRMMLLQHTGNECPNCPRLMDELRKLSLDESYNTLYHHVASHSYNTNDAAYSSAAASLSKVLNITSYYPWLTYNLTTEEGYTADDFRGAIDRLHEDVAKASVAAAVSSVENSIYVNVSMKAGVASKYRVAVWLLEDNIRSIQSGATASWQNMHDNCLRAMFGNNRTECIYGKNVGNLEAGQSCDFIAAFDLQPDWKAENCKVMVIAVAGNGDYDLVNCAVCPVDASITYDYK